MLSSAFPSWLFKVPSIDSQRNLRPRPLSYKQAACVSSLREGNVGLLMEQFLCSLKRNLAINRPCSLLCLRMAPLNISAVARWCARESQLKEKDVSLWLAANVSHKMPSLKELLVWFLNLPFHLYFINSDLPPWRGSAAEKKLPFFECAC